MIALALTLLLSQRDVAAAHRRVVTADGASLALHRFAPSARTAGVPVLLLADVGFGRPLYDFKQRGLARWLASRGRTVYVAELRGQGASSPGHSLRTAVHLDLPAIAAAIAREHAGPVDLIAHGYLGTLALAASGRELNVRRVIALQTPMLVEPPTELLEAFLSEGGRFSSLASSPEGFETFRQLFAMGADVDDVVLRGLAGSTRDLSRGVSAELLSWLGAGDLPLDDGTTVLGRLRAYERPTLLLLGLADGFAPPESCAPLRELSRAKVEVRLFSRIAEDDDFSHASLLLGRRAQRHVFPEIERFLGGAP